MEKVSKLIQNPCREDKDIADANFLEQPPIMRRWSRDIGSENTEF